MCAGRASSKVLAAVQQMVAQQTGQLPALTLQPPVDRFYVSEVHSALQSTLRGHGSEGAVAPAAASVAIGIGGGDGDHKGMASRRFATLRAVPYTASPDYSRTACLQEASRQSASSP